MVQIADVVTNGLTFDVKNWHKKIMTENDILKSVDDLFNTLEQYQVNYLLVGGIALLSYVDGRNTQDIDFILSRKDLDTLSEIKIINENKDFIRGNFNNLQIDILLTQNKFFDVVLKKFSAERKFGERLIQCVTVEGLIVLKLYALPSLYRQENFDRASIYENDILLLMLNYVIELQPLLKLLKKYILVSDLEEIQEIVADIEGRIARFARQKKKLEG